MNITMLMRFRRAACIAFSRHPAARWHRAWRYFTEDSSGQSAGAADLLLPPLTLLMLMLFLFGSVSGAGDMIAEACSIACMP